MAVVVVMVAKLEPSPYNSSEEDQTCVWYLVVLFMGQNGNIDESMYLWCLLHQREMICAWAKVKVII